MNNVDMLAEACLKRELDYLQLVLGYIPPQKQEGYFPSNELWLTQQERLTIIWDYLNERLDQLQ